MLLESVDVFALAHEAVAKELLFNEAQFAFSRDAELFLHFDHGLDVLHCERENLERILSGLGLTGVILLCAIMYAICCSGAFYAAEIGLMRSFAPRLLLATALPTYALFYVLVRCGKTRRLRDPNLFTIERSLANNFVPNRDLGIQLGEGQRRLDAHRDVGTALEQFDRALGDEGRAGHAFEVNRRAEMEIQALSHKMHLLGDKIADVEDLIRQSR